MPYASRRQRELGNRIIDVVNPLRYRGVDTVRERTREWFSIYSSQIGYEITSFDLTGSAITPAMIERRLYRYFAYAAHMRDMREALSAARSSTGLGFAAPIIFPSNTLKCSFSSPTTKSWFLEERLRTAHGGGGSGG